MNLTVIKNASTRTNLYIVNNPDVNGFVVYDALISILGLNAREANAALLMAHTRGIAKIEVPSQSAMAQLSSFQSHLAMEGYLQPVLVNEERASLMKIEKQARNDVFQKIRVVSEKDALCNSSVAKIGYINE